MKSDEERARRRAAEADAAQAHGESLERLRGLPLAIKDSKRGTVFSFVEG